MPRGTKPAGQRRSVRLEDWPPQDSAAWQAALAEGDVFEGQGPGAHLAPASRRSIANGYGVWLAYLQAHHPDVLDRDPADRMDPQRLRGFVSFLEGFSNGTTVLTTVRHTYDALRLMAPEVDWTWLKRIKAHLERRARPLDRSGRVVDAARLYALGVQTMADAEAKGLADLHDLLAYRDGFIVAFLISRPLRRRSLALLDIDRHLRVEGELWRFVLPEDDHKGRGVLDIEIPSDLVAAFETYLRVVRPRIPGAVHHTALWASSHGGRLGGGQIYMRIARLTGTAFGQPVNLHLFRACAATTVAIHDSANVGMVRDLLGHARLETSQQYYVMARGAEAGAVVAERLERLRHELRRHRPKPLKRSA